MSSLESLKARNSIIEPTSDVVYDHIDEFISRGSDERPWQVFELTQNQDVTEWIRNPDKIELLQPTLSDLASQLSGTSKPFRVLDVGCYGGYVFDYLKAHAPQWKSTFDYTGIDIQPRAVEDARAAHAQDSNAQFAVGDLFQLSRQFPAASFDAVICYRVLHHLPRFEQCLRELSSVTRGILHTALPIKDRSQCVRMKEQNRETGAVTYSYFRHFSREEIDRAASALSLTVEVLPHPRTPYSTVVFSSRP